MLRAFKRFANYVNSFRKFPYDFHEEVKKEVKSGMRILEVGCNLRPILQKEPSYTLDGLDPDPNIDTEAAKKIFDHFYNCGVEELDGRHKYDLIVLDMVFEHLEDNRVTMDILKNVLNQDGKIMMQAPSNFHPFTLLNQILPQGLKVKVLKTLRPWSDPGSITGWKSYYHKCNILSIKPLLRSKGLKLERAQFTYNGADYFAFFPPLFLLVVLYEEFTSLLRLSPLASHFMLVIGFEKHVGTT